MKISDIEHALREFKRNHGDMDVEIFQDNHYMSVRGIAVTTCNDGIWRVVVSDKPLKRDIAGTIYNE